MPVLAAAAAPADYDAPAVDRAAAGAALLDRHLPGWADQVTRPVQVDSVTDCLVAQAYGSWVGGALRLPLNGGTVGYGFLSRDNRDREALEIAWVREVASRAGTVTTPAPTRWPGLARLLPWRRAA